jgi:UDP-N-acetylmuramyl pentapeptide phosphotransferase/UDP-N-acetylglucosamine-1-phosphate transferase
MHSAIISLLLSLLSTVLLLQFGGRLRAGPLARGLQPVPIGGLALMVGLCGGVLAIVAKSAAFTDSAPTALWWVGLSALLPLFMVGGADDFWLPPSLLRRAIVTFVMAWALCTGFDASLIWIAAAVVFVTAVTHSVNAVDSRNGAAAICSLLIHAALACVAHSVNDTIVMQAALIVIGALVGVSFFSFQTDLARLGHSGCALVGFSTAGLAVCLTVRHPEVSALFALLLCSHSLIAAAGAWHRGGVKGLDDNADNRVPSLLYHRLVRWATGNPPDRRRPARDTSVMPHLWMLSVASIAPALLWWQQTQALAAALAFRVLLQWAVSRLLDVPRAPPCDTPAAIAAVTVVTELPDDPGFFPTSAKRSSRAESGTP